MGDTSMGIALRKAGVVDDHQRLRRIATDIHAKAGASNLGVQRLCKELTQDQMLLRAIAQEYLETLPDRARLQPRLSNEGERGLFRADTHHTCASPPSPRSAAERLAAVSTMNVVSVTIMDTMKVNGKSWGDITWGQLENIRFNSARDAAIAKQLLGYAKADAFTKVRDGIGITEFQRIVRKASEEAE